jgi:hypothetical protein
MILDILIAVLSGFVSTITMWSLRNPLTLNSIYVIALTTLWMIFFMSIIDNRKYYFIGSIFGLIIIYYMIRSQIFIGKNQLYDEVIGNHEKLIMMSKEVLDNSGISTSDKKRIVDIIRHEKERLNLIKNKY